MITEKQKKQAAERNILNKEIIAIYKKGGNVNDIETYLKSINREKTIRQDIFQANLVIKEEAKLERESLINIHIKRYEQLFEENIEKRISDFIHIPQHLRKYALIDCYVIAMDALIAKERVLGLHTRSFRVQMNNFFKKKIVSQYNFNQQNFNDLIRLKELLDKMKTTETIVVSNDADFELREESKTIDVSHVEVNTQVSDKIKEELKVNIDTVKQPKEIVTSITQKIIKEDIKKSDPKRKSFLEKLKKI